MVAHFFTIFTILTITTISAKSHSSVNELYQICSNTNFSCGKIQKIGYPFWGDDRPPFCGVPEFQLFCPDDSIYPVIHIGSTPYWLLNINIITHTMTLVSDYFLNISSGRQDCRTSLGSMASLNHTLYDFSKGVTNLTISYGCSKPPQASMSFPCLENVTNITASYLDHGSCRDNITVPVSSKAKEKMERNGATMSLFWVLSEGFEVEYKVNFTACERCTASQGSCSSSVNGTPRWRPFVCLCPDGPSSDRCMPRHSRWRVKVVIGVGAAFCSVTATSIVFLFYLRHYKKHHCSSTLLSRNASFYPSNRRGLEDDGICGVNLFTHTELEVATNNFHDSNRLGDGGYGTVYHGKLADGREVAIKRLYENNSKRVQQFMNEIQILTRLHHKNLVTLYGCTSHHSHELLLVYEFIPNGTVADHLHGDKAKLGALQWPTRLRIAIETASVLVYLHASDIIHRDIKTTNILLDENFSVKVADFGMSRLFPLDATHVSTSPQGTPGYLDPEYHECYQLTEKSDVFSFGVVLVELISSKPAVDISRSRHDINLSTMFLNRIRNNTLHELIDASLGFESNCKVRDEITAVAGLAFRCLQGHRDLRPSMEELLEGLLIVRGDHEKRNITDNAEVVDIPADDMALLKKDLSLYSPPTERNSGNL